MGRPRKQLVQRLGSIFPNRDVENAIKSFPRASTPEIANTLLDEPTILLLPVKLEGEPEVDDDIDMETASEEGAADYDDEESSDDSGADTDDDRPRPRGLPSDEEAVAKLIATFKRAYAKKCTKPLSPLSPKYCFALARLFPRVRIAFLKQAFNQNGRYFNTIMAAWMVANGMEDFLSSFAGVNQHPMMKHTSLLHNKRHADVLVQIPPGFDQTDLFVEDFKMFKGVVEIVSLHYPMMLDPRRCAFKLFKCRVCFLFKKSQRAVKCGKNGKGIHSFCRTCMKQYASYSTTEYGLPDGGEGFKCMEAGCSKVIELAQVERFLPDATIQAFEENVQLMDDIATGSKSEYCPYCKYCLVLPIDAPGPATFDCPECHNVTCRHCHRDWNEEHVGKLCSEVLSLGPADKARLDKEEKESEKIIKKCPYCKRAVVKVEGCNSMVCICGKGFCYACSGPVLGHAHFCSHTVRLGEKCNHCDGCSLFS